MTNVITKKGVIRDGVYLIPCEYDDIKPAIVNGKESDDIFITLNGGLKGIVKYNSEEQNFSCIEEGDYFNISDFENNIAIISEYCDRFGEKFAIINTDLNIITDFKYDKIVWLSNEYLEVVEDGKHGVIDTKGNVIIACAFNEIYYYPDTNKLEVMC